MGTPGCTMPRNAARAPDLPAALMLRVLGLLPANEVACAARLVSKEAAQHFSSPQQRAVHLTQPLPPHALALLQYWEQGLPGLTFEAKLHALSAAAASGCQTNLEVAWQLAKSCLIPGLPDHHYPGYDIPDPCTAAINHGHAHLLPWLLEHGAPVSRDTCLQQAAALHDLPTLQRVLALLYPSDRSRDDAALYPRVDPRRIAHSRTPDALDKMGWALERWGARVLEPLLQGAIELGDLPRLQWLKERGAVIQRTTGVCVVQSPCAGVEVAAWVEAQGGMGWREAWLMQHRMGAVMLRWAVHHAGEGVPQKCWDEACWTAARAGDAQLVAQLHGRGGALTERVWEEALGSKSLELLSWLLQQGCARGHSTFQTAAFHGSVEVFEWLVREVAGDMPADVVTVTVQHWPRSPRPQAPPRTISAPVSGWGSRNRAHLRRVVQLLLGMGCAAGGPPVVEAAARRGDLPLAQLLHSLGAPCSAGALVAAATAGCEDVLRWVWGQLRAPPSAGEAREAYMRAAQIGDAATLRALRRMGVPYGLDLRAVRRRCGRDLARALEAFQAAL